MVEQLSGFGECRCNRIYMAQDKDCNASTSGADLSGSTGLILRE